MVHTDKIVKELEIAHTGVLDFKEFLQMLKDFFGNYNYDITEKVYDTKTIEGLKTTTIKWDADRKLDDYNKGIFKLTFSLNDYKDTYVEKKKVIDGKFKLKLEVEMERDYDENWKKVPTRRFLRSIYDKYIAEKKQSKVDKEVKETLQRLREQVKKYLGE